MSQIKRMIIMDEYDFMMMLIQQQIMHLYQEKNQIINLLMID